MIEYFASGIVGALAMYGFLHGAKRVVLGVWFWYGRREVRKADRAKAERRAERERNEEWAERRQATEMYAAPLEDREAIRRIIHESQRVA